MLNCIVDISDYLLRQLNSKCKSIKFLPAFPSEISEFPIKQPTASLGIISGIVPLTECIFDGLDDKGNKYYGTTATCEFSLKICVPKTMAGIECYKAFDKIADVCLQLEDVVITNIYCGSIKYNRTMGALVLTAGINLSAELGTVFIISASLSLFAESATSVLRARPLTSLL